jgi:hypothetical protein
MHTSPRRVPKRVHRIVDARVSVYGPEKEPRSFAVAARMRRVTQEESGRPFDEQTALAELERLRDSIQAARQARQRTSDEFDAFVKSFRTPASTPTSERRVAPSRTSEAAQQASESIGHPVQSLDPSPSTVVVSARPK